MGRIGLRFRYRSLSRFRVCPERGFRILGHTCTGKLEQGDLGVLAQPQRRRSKTREGPAKPPYDKGNAQLPCVLSSSPLQLIGNVRQTRRRLLRLCAMLLKRNDSRACEFAIPASPHHAHGPGSSHLDQSWDGTDLSWALLQTTIVSSTCGDESLGTLTLVL